MNFDVKPNKIKMVIIIIPKNIIIELFYTMAIGSYKSACAPSVTSHCLL